MNNADPEAELREKILALTYACPRGEYLASCPFQRLRGLSHDSRRTTLARLNREELLRLFELVPACNCPMDPRP